MQDDRKNDEIDLRALLISFIIVIRANFWILVFFVALGIGLGIGFYFTSGKVYEAKMIIRSNILTEPFCKNLFDNAQTYINEQNNKTLAAHFNISEDVASKISSLKVEALDKSTTGTKPEESERFLITATVLDRAILGELQKGITTYLQSNDFVKIRVEQNKSYFKQMIASVEKEIADLEDFKTRIYKGDFFSNAKGNVMFDPTEVNTKIIELTEKKISYINSLQLVDSVQLIDGFTQFQRQVFPKLSWSVLSGLFGGLAMSGVFLVFRFFIRLAQEAKSAA